MSTTSEQQNIRDQVREGYAQIARKGSWLPTAAPSDSGCCGGGTSGGCCGPSTLDSDALARAIGYSNDQLSAAPDAANLGLSCGNPTALASLRPGEVVLDLGAGGGFDCFIAGRIVGAAGRVIGVDMTPDMLSLARRNVATYEQRTGLGNVEFRLGEIEHLPVADARVDVVISNCVINLSPDKPQVWREIARVLKPGGRVAVSDLALLRPLPDAVRGMVDALVGCVAGAALVDETRAMAAAAGLLDIRVTTKPEYVATLMRSDDPLYGQILAALPPDTTPADFVTSMNLEARRSAAACCNR